MITYKGKNYASYTELLYSGDFVAKSLPVREARPQPEPEPQDAPPGLDDVIGNAPAVLQIRTALDAYRGRLAGADGGKTKSARAKTFPHLLMAGPAGTGKTMLAEIIAREVGRPMRVGMGQSLQNPARVADFLLSLRSGDVLFVDECLPAGTVIETPRGRIPIERLRVGDNVYGEKNGCVVTTTVKRLFRNPAPSVLVEINGVPMTANHPVWTDRGYVPAFSLTSLDTVSHIVCNQTHENKTTLPNVPGVQQDVLGLRLQQAHVLLSRVCGDWAAQDAAATAHKFHLPHLQDTVSVQARETEVLLTTLRSIWNHLCAAPGMGSSGRTDGTDQSGVEKEAHGAFARRHQSVPQSGGSGESTDDFGRKGICDAERWQRTPLAAATADSYRRDWMDAGVASQHERASEWHSLSHVLQGGPRQRFTENRYRGGRGRPQLSDGAVARREKAIVPGISRMVDSEIQKRRSASRASEGARGDCVYNIETETGNYFADTLLVHNCHGLRPACQETFYRAMESGVLMPIDKPGEPVRPPIPLPPFTLLGATTNEWRLLEPLLQRFRYRIRLERMTAEELSKAIAQRAQRRGWSLDDEAAAMIAQRAHGTPRLAVMLLDGCMDVAIAGKAETLTAFIVERACEIFRLDALGLDAVERRYLSVLLNAHGEPVRLNVIASQLDQLSRRTLEFRIEPTLIWLGLLEKTESGRVLTVKGQEYMRPVKIT